MAERRATRQRRCKTSAQVSSGHNHPLWLPLFCVLTAILILIEWFRFWSTQTGTGFMIKHVAEHVVSALRLASTYPRTRATSALRQRLQQIVQDELEPFSSHGIDEALLERAWCASRLRKALMSDDFLRIRVLKRQLFMTKRGRCLHERHKAFLEGLLGLLATHELPDVDFIVSMNDKPPCEAAGNESLPIGTFSKRSGCNSILVPCFSMMQDRRGATHSCALAVRTLSSERPCTRRRYTQPKGIYSYHRLTQWRRKVRSNRFGGLWFDSNGQQRALSMRGLAPKLPDTLPLIGPKDQLSFFQSLHSSASPRAGWRVMAFPADAKCANATHWVYMEGIAWSMRLKNILLCGALVFWPNAPGIGMRYREYWHALIEPDEHMLILNTSEPNWEADLLLGERARQVASRASDVAEDVLHPENIKLYLLLLLRQYSRLQRFSPAALSQDGFVRVTKISMKYFCTCQAGKCFDTHLHLVGSCRAPDQGADLVVRPQPEISCMQRKLPRTLVHDQNLTAKVMQWCDCVLLCESALPGPNCGNRCRDWTACKNAPTALQRFPLGVCSLPLTRGFPYRNPGHFLDAVEIAQCWHGRASLRALDD